MVMEQHIEPIKGAVSTMSLAVVGATFINWLPPIAALFSILWSALMIWESKTVQDWLAKRKAKKNGQLPSGSSDHPGA